MSCVLSAIRAELAVGFQSSTFAFGAEKLGDRDAEFARHWFNEQFSTGPMKPLPLW
jgi:hypothetical protein